MQRTSEVLFLPSSIRIRAYKIELSDTMPDAMATHLSSCKRLAQPNKLLALQCYNVLEDILGHFLQRHLR